MDSPAPTASASGGGFSLIEALVALALVSMALLMGLAILLRQPRAQERLYAGGEALRAVEASIETLRARPGLPLDERRLAPGVEYPENVNLDGLQIWLESSSATGPEGLWSIAVEARYSVGRETHRRRVETLVWRAP